MFNFKKVLAVVVIAVSALATTACTTTNVAPKPNNEITKAIEGYKTYINVINHGKDANFFQDLNVEIVKALGPEGTDYPPALAIIDKNIPTNVIFLTPTTAGTERLTAGLRLMSLMTLNTSGDVVSVEIDPNKGKVNADSTVSLPKSSIVFSSKNNATSALADVLNNYLGKNAKGDVILHLTPDGYRVDIATSDF